MHLPDNTLLQRGKYRIIHYINGGGFGYTYEAEHVMLHKRVAIKEFFYKKETLRNADNSISIPSKNMEMNLIPIRKKFIEEAIFLSQANHPSIISVTDVFEENETAYYVMDYIDGKSLSQILKEQGTLTETQAVDYICQVAEALKYVHSFNRLHLDIKPDNILVDSHSGRAILIDFGTCKHYDENSGEQTTGLLGMQTDGYAPIELANKTFSNFSPSTDVYELGATLYCLLSGAKPPIAASLSSGDEVIKPLPSHISAKTRHAVECSLKLRRKDRPQNMDELLLILRGEREYEEKLTNDNEATYFEQSTTSTHLLRLNTHLQDGKYKIVQHLSSGGFGNIYEALHTMRQVRVVIKEFYVSGLNKREGQTNNVILSSQNHQEIVDRLRHMFKEEARFGYQMKHKHIIPVIDIFEENNTIYYAMEYIDGMNLFDIIRTEGPLPESKVLVIINQVADALKYIHSLKRLHLNVKPSNIIINKQGKAFLSVAEANEMYEGITVGYSPLEQRTQKYSSWSPATDIYALGATLYNLLTGINPPDAQMLKDGEAELAPLPSNISESVKKSIKEAMRPLRKDRPQSIEEWVTIFSAQNVCQTQSKSTEKEETIFDSPVSEQTRKDYKSEFYKTYSSELESEAKNGNAAAEYALACCYDEGMGIKENIQLAIYWFEKAGNHGYLDAMVRLGFIYLGTAELYSKYANTNKCIFWYTKAAEQGDEYACFELGRFYKEGKIVKKDIAKAKYWFDKVIKHGGNNKVEAVNELNELIKYNDSKKLLFLLLTMIFTEFCLGVVAYDAMELNYHHSLVTTPGAELRTFRFGGMLASIISLVMVFSIGLKKYSKLGNICILAISCITILLAFQSFNSSILDIARIYYILTLTWVGGTFIYSCTSIKQAFRTPTNIIIIISMMLFSVMWFLFTCIKYGDTIF